MIEKKICFCWGFTPIQWSTYNFDYFFINFGLVTKYFNYISK